jgi:hypothetical protein
MMCMRITGVVEWPTPSNKEVQSFLGFTNFYCRFIQGFSDLARPMFDLTRKDSAWQWGEAEKSALEALRTHVISAPILVFPDETRPFRVEADSSDFATGAVLSQQSPEDDEWQSGPWYWSGGQRQCHTAPSGVLCSSHDPSPFWTVTGRRRARHPSGYSQGKL